MKQQGLIAGVDAGATKIRAALLKGGRLIRVEGPGTNAVRDSPESAADRIASLLLPYLGGARPSSLAVGLAGAWSSTLRAKVTAELGRLLAADRLTIRNDAVAHLEAFNPTGPAMLLSAGTGAVLVGTIPGKDPVRVDGWGAGLGDAGSATWIGRRALELALAIHDGREIADRNFTRALLKAAHLTDPGRDIHRLYRSGFQPAEFARLVVRLARRGNRSARRILEEAACALARTVRAGLDRMPRGRVRLFLSGRLLEAVPELLRGARRLEGRRLKIDRSRIVPEAACLILAHREAGVPAPRGLMRRVERTALKHSLPFRGQLPPTERANPATVGFSRLPFLAQLELMNAEDGQVAGAIRAILPEVARAVRLAAQALKRGGRLIYVGAGTSGRLGILDASEARPTFGVKTGTVLGVIAGGSRAVTESVEGAEDRAREGARAMGKLRIGSRDAVVGLSASGTAPFVLAALKEATRRRAGSIAITCNPGSLLGRAARVALEPLTGPETVTGSTRLKAGTAQKMLLNMISTCAFARLGKIRGNVMARMVPGNAKLRARAVRIVARLKKIPSRKARRLLIRSGWDLARATGP